MIFLRSTCVKSWEKLDLRIVLFFAGILLFVPAFSKENKIEELFIWKISDELKLSIPEERKFSELFRTLSKKKSDLAKEQDEIVTRLAKAHEKNQKDFLKRYREILVEANKLPTVEFDEVKKLLGEDRVGKYLQVKRDLTNKVKNLLSEKTEKKESELPPPKVIEE
jgi:hypothetical protein